MNSILTVIIVE